MSAGRRTPYPDPEIIAAATLHLADGPGVRLDPEPPYVGLIHLQSVTENA